jgi:CheY-like chemotaxis protein
MSKAPTNEKLNMMISNSDVGNSQTFYSQYQKELKESLVNENLIISTFNTLISIISILIIAFILVFTSNLDYYPIQITKLSMENYTDLLNQNLTNCIFYEKYILINQTKIDLNFELKESLLPKNEENLFYAAENIFLRNSVIAAACLLIIYLLSIILQKFNKSNDKLVNIIFIINIAIFNGPIQIILFYLITYLNVNIVVLFYMFALQIISKIIMAKYSNQSKLNFIICFIANTIFDILLLFAIGNSNFYLANYTVVNGINNGVCIILYFLKSRRKEKDLKQTYNILYERQSANDLINNMSVGYIKILKKDIILNKSILKILSYISNENLSIPEDQSFRLVKRNSFGNTNLPLINRKTEFDAKQQERNKKIISILSDLFRQMDNFGEDLPKDVVEMFNEEKIKNIEFENLYNKILQYDHLSEFTCLGTVDAILKIDSRIIRKYQIMIRVNEDEQSNKSLEMLFSDVTDIVEIEKEKAFEKSRSIYLAKIAHEFKNPLTSVIELSKSISSSLSTCTKESLDEHLTIEKKEFKEISINTDYIEVICKKMCQFIKDYSVLNNLKFKCEAKCKNFHCESCFELSFCVVCKICLNCEKKCNIKIDTNDLLQNILQIFKQIKFFEKKDFINLNFKSDNSKILKLYSNYELLYSSIFNILLFYYKNTISKSSVNINLFPTFENSHHICNFEFIIENFNFNSEILLKLDSNFNISKFQKKEPKELIETNDDLLIKYFEILIAYQMIKKIGHLEIYNFENSTTFLLKLKMDEDSSKTSNKTLRRSSSLSVITEKTVSYQSILKVNYKELNLSNMKIDTTEKQYKIDMNEEYIEQAHEREKENVILDVKTNQSPKLNILIIDDEYLIRRTFIRQLNLIASHSMQFNLLEASNCFEALDIIYKKIHCDGQKIDIIIVDEFMPYVKGSTFISFIKQVSIDNPTFNSRIISHTAFDTNEKKQMILSKGADQILNKPVNNNQLKILIKDLV